MGLKEGRTIIGSSPERAPIFFLPRFVLGKHVNFAETVAVAAFAPPSLLPAQITTCRIKSDSKPVQRKTLRCPAYERRQSNVDSRFCVKTKARAWHYTISPWSRPRGTHALTEIRGVTFDGSVLGAQEVDRPAHHSVPYLVAHLSAFILGTWIG